MTNSIKIQPLTREAFAPFGDVIEKTDKVKNTPMNNGTAHRYWDLGTATATGEDAKVVFSIATAQSNSLPHDLDMFERHPYGSQYFMAITPRRFLVVVAPDVDGKPGEPLAFMVAPGQGINYHQNVWHGALVALDEETEFLIVDRSGVEKNIEKYFLDDDKHYLLAE